MRKKYFLSLILLITSLISFSQQDSITNLKIKQYRYPIWFVPSAAHNIYGIAIGPIGSEAICNLQHTRYTHGINIQIIGQGIFQTFYINKATFKEFYMSDLDSIIKRVVINGIVLSPFGTFSDQINGLSFSLWMSLGEQVNGISFNMLWNLYRQVNGISIGAVNFAGTTNGIQLGLINNTKKLKGLQIGLWNKNEKRSLPIINWNFS